MGDGACVGVCVWGGGWRIHGRGGASRGEGGGDKPSDKYYEAAEIADALTKVGERSAGPAYTTSDAGVGG